MKPFNHILLSVMLFLFLFIINQDAFSFEKKKITIGFFDSPPYAWKNSENQIVGICPTLMKEIFGNKLEYSFVMKPWKRILHEVKDGSIDAVGCFYKTAKREKEFIFTKRIFSEKDYIYIKGNSQLKINKVEDLVKLKGVSIRGASYLDTINFRKKKHILVSTYEKMAQILDLERADYGIIPEGSADYLIESNKIKSGTIKKILLFKSNPVFMGISRNSKSSLDINKINALIKKH